MQPGVRLGGDVSVVQFCGGAVRAAWSSPKGCFAGLLTALGRACGGAPVPEAYCCPGAIYTKHEHVDLIKLRRLIQEGKLSPMFPGQEEAVQAHPQDELVGILVRVLNKVGTGALLCTNPTKIWAGLRVLSQCCREVLWCERGWRHEEVLSKA